MKSTEVFVKPGHSAIVSCPYCHCRKEIPVAKFKGKKCSLKIKCSCAEVYIANLEFRKKPRKKTKLPGTFTNHSQKKFSGEMVVKNLSMGGLEFVTSAIDKFKNGDELSVTFNLDNDESTPVHKEVTVCSVRKRSKSVGCEFLRSADITIDKDLGIYLMP